MSYNLVDPTTGDLTRVAGNSNIVDTAIEIDSTWSSSKIYSAINSIGFKGDAPENANSATTPGVYLINRNDDAYPVRQGYLIVSKPRQDYDCILQEVYYFNANKIYSRGCWFNSWYDWQELATMDKVESKYSEENILTSTDWNTLNTKARYYFSGGTPMTNSPEKVPFGLLEVINVGSYCLIQRYFAFNGKLYIRRWSGNNWNEWYKFDGISI